MWYFKHANSSAKKTPLALRIMRLCHVETELTTLSFMLSDLEREDDGMHSHVSRRDWVYIIGCDCEFSSSPPKERGSFHPLQQIKHCVHYDYARTGELHFSFAIAHVQIPIRLIVS